MNILNEKLSKKKKKNIATHTSDRMNDVRAALADELTGILIVEISGLKEETGDVYIAVFDSDSTWLSEETVLDKKVVIADALDGDVVRTELQLPLGTVKSRVRLALSKMKLLVSE